MNECNGSGAAPCRPSAEFAGLAAAILVSTLLLAVGPDAASAAPKDYTTRDVIEFFKAVQGTRRPSAAGDAPAAGAVSGGVCLGTPEDCRNREAAADGDAEGESEPDAPAVASVEADEADDDAFDLLVSFDYDSAELSPGARARLRRFAAGINSPELREAEFLIQGHTDARGSFAYNQDLSFRRAAEVVRFLVDEGVGLSRLTAQGFGEQAPRVGDPFDPANRRVQSQLIP